MKRETRLSLIALLAGSGMACDSASDAGTAERAEVAVVSPSEDPSESAALDTDGAALQVGRRVLESHQCARCHEIDGLPGVGKDFDCVTCHEFLHELEPAGDTYARLSKKYGADVIDRYRGRIRHYLRVPKLTGIGRVVRRDWLQKFVRAPHDLRPHLEESMFRNRLSEAEARAIGAYFELVAHASDSADQHRGPPPSPGSFTLAEGRALLARHGCGNCHLHGGAALGTTLAAVAANSSAVLAPDLRWIPERTRPEVLVDWIRRPAHYRPGTAMPAFPGTETEALEVARFLLQRTAPAADPPSAAPLPGPATRKLTWTDVKRDVLGAVCVHCHMNDHEADAGAGNGGGLGYDGVDLSFRTYARAMAGARSPDGSRYSVFEPRTPGAEPPVVQAVERRRRENRRDHIPPGAHWRLPASETAAPGMPLGLPALDDAQVAVLRGWIAQGCPGPTEHTGRPDIDNGYLVPDGPIDDNEGCHLRPLPQLP